MPPHPSTNFGMQKYYQNESEFNGFYLRNDLSKMKNGAYMIKLDQCESTGTHWIALYVNAKNVTSFGVREFNIFQKKLENL